MFFLIGLFYWQLMDLDVKYLDVFSHEVDFCRREFYSLIKIGRFKSLFKNFVEFDISIRREPFSK